MKVVWISLICTFSFIGCRSKQLTQNNQVSIQPKQTKSVSVEKLDSSDKDENNIYFFNDISLNTKQFTCEGTIWGDVNLPNGEIEDITEEDVKANLVVTEVAKLIKGKVYEFNFSIQGDKVNPVYKEQELFLWVTSDGIYKLSPPADNFNKKDFVIDGNFDNLGHIKMLEKSGQLPNNDKSLIRCSPENMKFKDSENSLWETEILVKDNICTYVRSHNSGHFEKFVWELDKGLTNYSWGQGAGLSGMKLTIIK